MESRVYRSERVFARNCCGPTESVLRRLQPESIGSTGSARRQNSATHRFASFGQRVGAAQSRPFHEGTASGFWYQARVQGMCCTYWKLGWHTHRIATFIVALSIKANVRTQWAPGAHLVLNRSQQHRFQTFARRRIKPRREEFVVKKRKHISLSRQ